MPAGGLYQACVPAQTQHGQLWVCGGEKRVVRSWDRVSKNAGVCRGAARVVPMREEDAAAQERMRRHARQPLHTARTHHVQFGGYVRMAVSSHSTLCARSSAGGARQAEMHRERVRRVVNRESVCRTGL